MKKLKVLITGVGITGKSTFRRELYLKLRKKGISAEHFDADKFEEIRHPIDRSCLKQLPEKFDDKVKYIIEDIHSTMPFSSSEEKPVLPLKDYDLIFYLLPDFFSHLFFWLPRMRIWFQNGYFSWEAGQGWQGTGKSYDLRNLPGILKNFLRDFKNRQKWIKEDKKILSFSLVVIIHPRWTRKGIRFSPIPLKAFKAICE